MSSGGGQETVRGSAGVVAMRARVVDAMGIPAVLLALQTHVALPELQEVSGRLYLPVSQESAH
eukprot:5244256-Pyramimonas_sp.AAC.1